MFSALFEVWCSHSTACFKRKIGSKTFKYGAEMSFWLWECIWSIWNFKIVIKKCSNSLNFWGRKMFFFCKWVTILPEVDCFNYQGSSPASNNDKDPYEVKCHIRAQCAPSPPLPPQKKEKFFKVHDPNGHSSSALLPSSANSKPQLADISLILSFSTKLGKSCLA